MLNRFGTLASLAAAAALLATGCVAEQSSEEIGSSLEKSNGGLTMNDEAPMFGDESEYIDLETDVAVADTMESDAEVIAMIGAGDAKVYNTTILWGQMPLDLANDQVRDWSGRLSVNRGAIVIRRTVGFEPQTDRVAPRTDRRIVDFQSMTRPFADGFRLLIVDPTPDAADPLVLSYERSATVRFDFPVRDLLDGPVSRDVGTDGDRIVATAFERRTDACDHGFLRGRWHRIGPNRGLLMGIVSNADGERIGHLRGLYGQRLNGNKVFFGKYINREGQFRGIFAGEYGEGSFRGRWLSRIGEHGVLGGEYRETRPARDDIGHFLGRWAETSCNLDLAR